MKACKECRCIVETEKTCPLCNGELSERFHGMIVVLNHEKSDVAKVAGIKVPGRFAIKVK